ncbi:MAG: hypothetical protein GYA17_12845, partial [Chloroflexi bacterium]|nr:hypothetical protein [Chloroflexota bacterium]
MLTVYLNSFWTQLQSGQFPELGLWTYALIALLAIFEGPVVTLVSAAAASTGALDPLLVFVSAASGNLTGDSCWHCLGRFGKPEWILRLGVRAHQLEHFKDKVYERAPR